MGVAHREIALPLRIGRIGFHQAFGDVPVGLEGRQCFGQIVLILEYAANSFLGRSKIDLPQSIARIRFRQTFADGEAVAKRLQRLLQSFARSDELVLQLDRPVENGLHGRGRHAGHIAEFAGEIEDELVRRVGRERERALGPVALDARLAEPPRPVPCACALAGAPYLNRLATLMCASRRLISAKPASAMAMRAATRSHPPKCAA